MTEQHIIILKVSEILGWMKGSPLLKITVLTLRWDLSCNYEPPEGCDVKNIGQTDVRAEGLSQVEQKLSINPLNLRRWLRIPLK